MTTNSVDLTGMVHSITTQPDARQSVKHVMVSNGPGAWVTKEVFIQPQERAQLAASLPIRYREVGHISFDLNAQIEAAEAGGTE